MTIDNNEFSADELAFISSRGEDSEALGRAYSSDSNQDSDEDLPRHPEMDRDEQILNGHQSTKEEIGDDDGDDDENGANGSRFVPHGQFHKERTRRQSAESELADFKVKMAKAEERLAILNEFMQGGGHQQNGQGQYQNAQNLGKSAWEEDDIDPEEDFSGAIAQLKRRQAEDREARNEWQQRSEARTQEGQQAQAYIQSAVAYARQNPEFAGAYKHLMQTYHQELQAYGMSDQAQRNQHIRQEEKKLAKFALENRQNPAEVIMHLAKARGFVPKQDNQDQNSKETADVPSLADAAHEVKGKVENIKKAAKSSASLSNAGGGAKNGLTMESILNMDDDEFFATVHKMPAEKRRKLFAG